MQRQFDSFTASQLYCPQCSNAMQTRERLLLILPDGEEIYDFICTRCGTSLGEKRVTVGDKKSGKIFLP